MLAMRTLTMILLSVCACGGKPAEQDAATRSDAKAAGPSSTPDAGPTSLVPPSTTFPAPVINALESDCPELPALAKHANKVAERAAQLAAVMRHVACDPQLYTLSTATLAKTLGLPSGVLVRFNSANRVHLSIEDMPPTRALAAALGIDEPVARLHWVGADDQWRLGNNPETGELDRFGPGVINIGLRHEADQDDPEGEVVPLQRSMQAHAGVVISMPNAVVSLGSDPEGLAQLAAAMAVLAARPELMSKQPVDIARELGLVHERFRVVSVHDGISIQPMRTRIPADAFANALGLELSVDGITQLEWRGFTLEIEIEAADGNTRATTLANANVDFITMRPR